MKEVDNKTIIVLTSAFKVLRTDLTSIIGEPKSYAKNQSEGYADGVDITIPPPADEPMSGAKSSIV